MRFEQKLLLIWLCFNFPCGLFAQVRQINSLEDKVRLEGFTDFRQRKKDFENQRLSDVSEQKQEEQDWESQRKKALDEFKAEHRRLNEMTSESGVAYRRNVNERTDEVREDEVARESFVEQRDRDRILRQRRVHLSEEKELKLDLPFQRVDWSKRRFYSTSDNISQSNGQQKPNYQNSNGYWNNGSGYYETPPPPPPPNFYNDYQY